MKNAPALTIGALLAAIVVLQSIMLNDPARIAAPTLDTSTEGRLLNQLSLGLRQTLATALFLRTDEYMHRGDPVKMVTREDGKVVKESDMGVSWRMNQEIVTLLQFVAMLDPSFTRAHTLLGEHLTRDRHKFRQGVHHLQQAILYNEHNPRLYVLYGQLGSIYYESKMYPQAKGYLLRALELYPRVRSPHLAGTPYFETAEDRMNERTFMSYLTACYFEERDWPNTYKWWSTYGGFGPENRISRWMQRWTLDPNATFRPEDYKEPEQAPRTETERHKVTETSFEQGKAPEVWLTPDFPAEFYHKMWFLLTIVIAFTGAIYFKSLW